MKRVISLLLAIVFICSTFVITVSAEDDSISEYEIVVVSTEYAYDTCRIYADAQDKYYMSVYDITRYTRSTYTESNGKIKITHGTRELTLDVDKKSLVENNRKNDIEVITYNNQVLVHAAPLLTYLGATCDVSDNRLVIAMPSYTLWEALVLTGDENYIRAEDAFGSELEIKTRLLLNGILKFMDSGFGDAINAEYSSVLLALQVDVSNYDKYFDTKAQDDIKNLNLFQSMVAEGDALESLVDFSDDMKKTHKIISAWNDPVSLFVINEAQNSPQEFWGKWTGLTFSTISSVSETMKTSKDSFAIVTAATKHMSRDARFYNNLSYAQANLSSLDANIIASLTSNATMGTVFDSATSLIDKKYAIDHNFITDKSFKLSITKMVEASVSISVLLNKAFCGENSIFNYADAETNVIELLRLKQDLANTINSLAEKITAENYSNADDLEDFRLLRVFYYRTLIAINEQFEAMIVAQWGKENQPEMRELIETLQNQSNLFAEKLYMLTVADTNALANIENVAKDNAWDSKIEPTLPSLDDEKDNINLDPPENCESFWTFDYGEDHTALMRVYCDEDGKIQLIEKYPLFDDNSTQFFLYNLKYNSKLLTRNDVFGMVSEKYVFSYRDDVLDKMTYYHTSESHLGIREFKKGYVMKFEELENYYPTLKGQIYVNNMPTYSYDIFEFHDDYITRSIYGNTVKVEKITYTSKGRPYSRESNVSPDSHNWYMTYDENGNIKTAGIYSHSNDVVEEYIFDIENDRLVGISFEKLTNSYQGTYSKYTATLTYNESGLFSKAEIQYPTYEVVCSAEYDDLNRVIESRYVEDNTVAYTLTCAYDDNGYFETLNYNVKSLTSTFEEINAVCSFKYDDDDNLFEVNYPDFDYSFSSYEMKTQRILYSTDGQMLNDGTYEYEYYPTGELYRRTEIGGDSYAIYYKKGLKKEEVYHYGNYTFTDYYDEVNFYHAFDERCLYWYLDEHSTVSTGGSPTAKKSIVVQSDGSKCEVERIFDEEYNLLKRIAYEYYPNGNLMRKTISEYNELGWQINGETITYDENGNVIS